MDERDLSATAVEALFKAGMLGIVWADAKQVVKAKRGKLAEPVGLDQPLCAQIPALLGMEADLKQLKKRSDGRISIPRVSHIGTVCSQKISIEVIWDKEVGGFAVLFHADDSLDKERAQVRQRRIRLITAENFHADVQLFHRNNILLEELAKATFKEPKSGVAAKAQDATEQDNPFSKLTPRESEVVKLLIKGTSNKLIAHILKISEKTVEVHRSNAIKRLGLKSSAELIRRAGKHGFG